MHLSDYFYNLPEACYFDFLIGKVLRGLFIHFFTQDYCNLHPQFTNVNGK